MKTNTFATAIAATLLLVGCGVQIEMPNLSYGIATETELGKYQMCGGLAGLACPDHQHCLIKDTYPDAAGVCVGEPTYKNWHDMCSMVLCAQPLCPDGFRLHYGPQNCCGTCLPNGDSGNHGQEGLCMTPSGCDGLAHIMCVGSWSCEKNTCSYSCFNGVVELE